LTFRLRLLKYYYPYPLALSSGALGACNTLHFPHAARCAYPVSHTERNYYPRGTLPTWSRLGQTLSDEALSPDYYVKELAPRIARGQQLLAG